jgi:hypothetical protein
MTLTELTVTRWDCLEARGDDGSGEASLLGANPPPRLGELIRIRDNESLNLGRQAHLRVIRRIYRPFRACTGPGLEGSRVAAMRSGGELWLAVSLRPFEVMAPARGHDAR